MVVAVNASSGSQFSDRALTVIDRLRIECRQNALGLVRFQLKKAVSMSTGIGAHVAGIGVQVDRNTQGSSKIAI